MFINTEHLIHQYMNICFVTPYSPKQVSGVGKFVSELSRSLKKRGIDSIIITKKVKNGEDLNLNIVDIEIPKIRLFGGMILTFKTIWMIAKKRKEIDIVNLQRPFIVSQALMALACKKLDLKIISTIHGGYPPHKAKTRMKWTKSVERFTFKLSDKVVFVDRMGQSLRKYPSGVLIENGVDTERFKFDHNFRQETRAALNIHEKDFTIVFVGRISFDKGIYELLEAVSKLKTMKIPNIKVLFIGSLLMEEKAKFVKYVNNLKLNENVLMLGVKDDVIPYYCTADIFALPSYSEGLPLALLEAMACGVPVVVSDVGGIPSVIENIKDGILVKPKNAYDLADKIEWCVKNPEKLKKIGENAREKARKEFNLERMTDEYILLFKELTGNN